MAHYPEALHGFHHRPTYHWRDAVALVLVVAIIVALGSGARHMISPLSAGEQPEISLSPTVLPEYALRPTMRMLAALVASLA